MVFSPLVSIIIPCYNYGRFLADALDSVLNQTYQSWECIIVNDGSTDITEEVAKRYISLDNRFKYYYQKNTGQWAARNTAIKHSLGKYLQFLDADDLLETEKLAKQVPLLEQNQNIDVVYSDIYRFDDKDTARNLSFFYWSDHPPQSGKGENIVNALLRDNFFLPGCVLMRKEVLNKLKEGFRKAYGLEDWDFWYRLATANCGFYHDNREGTRLLSRLHSSNVSINEKKLLKDRLEVRKRILNDIKLLHKENKTELAPSFIAKTIKAHNLLWSYEKTTYHLSYGNLMKGFFEMLLYSCYSGKPFSAIYRGSLRVKARLGSNLRKMGIRTNYRK